jgi:hypothetical protein
LCCFEAVHHHHREVIEQQPFLVRMDGKHGVNGPASRVAYDQEAQVIGADTCFAKRQVFQYCVVLTVPRSLFNSSEWRRPEIGNSVLAQITGGPDTQVHRTIDLSHSGATRALATKLNDLQQPARCCRARVGTCTTGRERLLLPVNAGQHIPPLGGDIPRQGLAWLNVGIIGRLGSVGRREQSNTGKAAILLWAIGALDGQISCRCGGPAFAYISQGVRLPSRPNNGVVVIRDSRRLIAGTAMVDFYGNATGNASSFRQPRVSAAQALPACPNVMMMMQLFAAQDALANRMPMRLPGGHARNIS